LTILVPCPVAGAASAAAGTISRSEVSTVPIDAVLTKSRRVNDIGFLPLAILKNK
jgi:hypothetical protein